MHDGIEPCIIANRTRAIASSTTLVSMRPSDALAKSRRAKLGFPGASEHTSPNIMSNGACSRQLINVHTSSSFNPCKPVACVKCHTLNSSLLLPPYTVVNSNAKLAAVRKQLLAPFDEGHGIAGTGHFAQLL